MLAVGAVVAIVSVTDAAFVGFDGLKLHVDSLGSPTQVYMTDTAVCWPLLTTNDGVLVLVTTTFTAVDVCPCLTVIVLTAG